MALIKCSECGSEVSDQAVACPVCGKPLKGKVTTIELTSKRWKLVKLISIIGIIIGGFIFLSNQKDGFQNPLTGVGLFILLISVLTRFVGKFGAWWTNR
jgi:DNA-directed RNA polymerase subunit RPC12/RpoP